MHIGIISEQNSAREMHPKKEEKKRKKRKKKKKKKRERKKKKKSGIIRMKIQFRHLASSSSPPPIRARPESPRSSKTPGAREDVSASPRRAYISRAVS